MEPYIITFALLSVVCALLLCIDVLIRGKKPSRSNPLVISMAFFVTIAILLTLLDFLFPPLSASAAENSSIGTGPYEIHYNVDGVFNYYNTTTGEKTTITDSDRETSYSVWLTSDYPLFAVKRTGINEKVPQLYQLQFMAYKGGKVKALYEHTDHSNALHTAVATRVLRRNIYINSRQVQREDLYSYSGDTEGQTGTWYLPQFNSNFTLFEGESNSYVFDGYIFDSDEAAKAFFDEGDTSGLVQRPTPDYDYDHDFRQDAYDPDIPVPQLSNLSHSGFHVDNADPSRDIEIYVESTFYGLKHTTNSGSSVETDLTDGYPLIYTHDPSWVYNTHRFNLINTDVSYSDADINIKEMFRADNVGALIEDFKNWSAEYPSHEKLPDYKWYKYQNAQYTSYYRSHHLYNTSVGKTDEEKIKLSAQASTTYFVRFCQYVPGEGYTWGKWASYTYTPAGYGHKDNTTIGDVEADPDTGKPIVKDPVSGVQDPVTGETTFPDVTTADLSRMISEVLDSLKSLISFFGEFPAFLTESFGFIPTSIWTIIGAGMVFLLVVAAIKFVKS